MINNKGAYETINVGEKIKRVRMEKNYSQEYMAEKLGMQQSSYSRLENRGDEITVSNLITIAFVLGKPITDFLPDLPAIQNNKFNLNQQTGNITHHYNYEISDEQLKLLSKMVAMPPNKG